MHDSPLILHSSPDAINESRIDDEQVYEAVAIQLSEQTTDNSCSNAASVLQNTQPTHTQQKPCSAREPIDIAQGPHFPLYSPLESSFQKLLLVIGLGHSIQHDIKVMSGLSILSH